MLQLNAISRKEEQLVTLEQPVRVHSELSRVSLAATPAHCGCNENSKRHVVECYQSLSTVLGAKPHLIPIFDAS